MQYAIGSPIECHYLNPKLTQSNQSANKFCALVVKWINFCIDLIRGKIKTIDSCVHLITQRNKGQNKIASYLCTLHNYFWL